MSPARRGTRAGILLLTTCAALSLSAVLPGAAAQVPTPVAAAPAHPFGDPQTVGISGGGDTVTVVWEVGGADDLTLLGIDLGVLPDDRVMLDGAITYEADDAVLVGDSDAFRAYLLERIEVAAAGAPCEGEVTDVDDLTSGGATIDFTCPGPTATAEVTVRMLTDLHPAYRTLATGPDGQRAVYDNRATTHTFDLGAGGAATSHRGASASASAHAASAEEELGRSAVLQLGAVLGAVLLVIVLGAVVLRRRGHRHHLPTTP